MHLGNGAITPECVVLTVSASAAGLAAAAVAARCDFLKRDKLALAAGLGGLVFAAQALNVPVAAGISAHLVGGVLLAWLLGPGLGACTMAIVLAVQALVLGDGGLAALGANILNMALLPAGLVAVGRPRSIGGASLLSGVAVPLAAGLILLQTALFRPLAELGPWSDFAVLMLGTHLWIGVLEGAATAALIVAIARFAKSSAAPQPAWRLATCCACLAALLALAWPLSSILPDGYEAAALATGNERLLQE
jgi:cobalt/nickel transport system permease protein